MLNTRHRDGMRQSERNECIQINWHHFSFWLHVFLLAPALQLTRAPERTIFSIVFARESERAWNWYMEEYLSNPIPMAIRRIWHFSDAIYFYKIFAIDLIRLKVENCVYWELVSANSREKSEKTEDIKWRKGENCRFQNKKYAILLKLTNEKCISFHS